MNLLVKSVTTDKGINYLNMALMLLSAAIAFYIPFHLFLFAYAVLGPLHYMTEISWLEKRSFFIPKKSDMWFFVVVCILIFMSFFVDKIANYTTAIMMVSVTFAFFSLFIQNRIVKIVLAAVLFIILASYFKDTEVIQKSNYYTFLFFAILLPTLIHVYVFTGLFIIAGALKQRSFTGFLSLIVFILCTLFFFVYTPQGAPSLSDELKLVFDKFKWMNRGLMYLFGTGGFNDPKDMFTVSDNVLYTHPSAIACMRFIAFAYCYHYLNWFSKTSVIKWHEVSKKRMITILLLWVLSVVLYAMNYNVGFMALFILSMLHVMCEFPLNIQTFKIIGQELGRLGSGGAKAPARKK
jgi:hypothetical protein